MTQPYSKFQSTRKSILIGVAVIGAIELPLFMLMATSIIPCYYKWIPGPHDVTVIRLFWDGRNQIDSHPRTIWTAVTEIAIWLCLAVGIAASGYLAAALVKRRRSA